MDKYYIRCINVTVDLMKVDLTFLDCGGNFSISTDPNKKELVAFLCCDAIGLQKFINGLLQLGITVTESRKIDPSTEARLYASIKNAEERQAEVSLFTLKYDKNNVGQLADHVQRLEIKIAELIKIIEDSGLKYEDPDEAETKTLFQRIKAWFGW